MSELTDDQLDGLFRKSAEEFDPPLDPAAWQDMEARLDAHDRPTTGGIPIWNKLLRWGLPVVLLLLLTGGAWYTYTTGRSTTGKTESGVVPGREKAVAQNENQRQPLARLSDRRTGRPTDKSSLSAESDNETKPANLPESLGTVSEPEKTAGKSVGTADATGRPTEAATTKRPATAYRPPSERDRTNPVRVEATSTEVRKSDAVRNRPARVSRLARNLSTQKLRKVVRNVGRLTFSPTANAIPGGSLLSKRRVTTEQQALQADGLTASMNTTLPNSVRTAPDEFLPINELVIRPGHWPDPLLFSGRDVVAQPDTVAQRAVSKPAAMRGLSVRFVVSPDLSSIGLKNFSRPGTNVGLMLEYRLASRWSVQAGVIQSTKVYKAQTADYGEVPAYLLNQHAKLERIDGRCNMFDIPINVRYDVFLRSRLNGEAPSRWFISGGVTSYIIKQEDYKYKYLNDANIYPDTPLEKSASTGGYGFSQLNISAGYERALSRRLSWQVEPFLKAPLRGVGYFKVNLLSTGAFFSLRYKL
ncbi:porin family protein [Spirosoma areae]